jgi:hypothetical protein
LKECDFEWLWGWRGLCLVNLGKENLLMALALEKRFETLVSDVQAIQKELILTKMQHIKKTRRIQNEWESLSQRVSASWDSVSAVDEITSQREKQW